MADAAPTTELDGIKARRDTRDELLRWLSFFSGLIPVFTAALGFSPLANIWTFLVLIVGFALVLALIWAHYREKGIVRKHAAVGTAGPETVTRPLPRRQRSLQSAAIVALIFGTGAWVGSSGRNVYLLAAYGTLGDLAIGPGRNSASPAVISLRKDRNQVCFFTTATFNVRNATSTDVVVGILSHTLTLTDDANAPIFSRRSPQDITLSQAGVSGVTLIKGTAEQWPKNMEDIKSHLTTLRRGDNIDATIYQNRVYDDNCIPDPDGKVSQNYKASTVRISGELVIVLPDGSWRRESLGVSEAAHVEK